VKDQAKQSSSSWYQSSRLITVQIAVVGLVLHRLGDEYVDGVLTSSIGRCSSSSGSGCC
jgi:hypothetical protein